MAIKLEHEELYAKASEYRNESEEVNAMLGRLDTLLGTLMEQWEGQAAVAFNNQYEEIKPSIQNLEQLLADVCEQLKKVADTMQEADNSIASGIGY
ncbi:MAG: WXG100 family type VII secretion target [Breznakia sp.]